MTDPGKRLADHLVAGLEAARAHHQEHGKQARHDEKREFLEILEDEGREAIEQILGDHIDKLELPAEIVALLDRVGRPEHQAEIGAIAGILIGVGYQLAGAVLAGPDSQLVIASMRTAGRYAMSPDQLAVGSITGRVGSDWAQDAAKDSGVSAGQFSALELMARSTLGPEQWVNYWRLYPELESTVDEGLRKTGLDDQAVAAIKATHLQPPSAAFAAQAATQNQIDMPTLERLLLLNGINPEWAKTIYETEGQTMPPQMANELFRRGFIDTATYEQILLESNLKNKYVPLLKDLRWRIPPMRQTIAAFHNGSITREVAAGYLSKLGFDEDVQRWMLDSAAKVSGSATHHLSLQQSVAVYEAQLWTRSQAFDAIVGIGWDEATANLELDLADHRQSVARQSKAANAIGTRYVGWKISRADASNALDALQLPTAARDEALAAWDIERDERRPRLTFTQLQHGFKKGAIDAAGVRGQLVDMGYDANQVAFLMVTYF